MTRHPPPTVSAAQDGGGALDRRLDLDWVRIAAFGVLILYHVGMFYVPWDFHVKSPRLVPGLEPLMVLVNPWRLTLLFLVSGAATRFMTARTRPGALAWARTGRLLPPLLLGMFVIVPPQSWLQVAEALHRAPQPYGAFWIRYATASGHWCDAKGCLTTPTWNHLWFVAYLLVYTLVLAAWLALAPGGLRRLQAGLERALAGWGVLVWPALACVALRASLGPRFPETHALWGDWYLHALSFAAVLFGFLVARSERVWADLERLRLPALLVGLAAWVAYAAYGVAYPDNGPDPSPALRRVMRVVYGVDQWVWIAAALGYARRYAPRRDSAARRYLTEAIFPFYIIHQTTIVVAGYTLAPLRLPLALEAGLLIALTAASCVATYELVRRVGWLRPLFGLKGRARAAGAPAQFRAATVCGEDVQ